MNNTVEGINSKLDKAEDQNNDLKEKVVENTQSTQWGKKEFSKMRIS